MLIVKELGRQYCSVFSVHNRVFYERGEAEIGNSIKHLRILFLRVVNNVVYNYYTTKVG